MNSENLSRTVRNDSLDMATIVRHPPDHGKGLYRRSLIAEQQLRMHNACMSTSITIRDVPDETHDELAARAARSGRSLQEYLRGEMIELARKPDIDTLLSRVARRKQASKSMLPAEKILVHRDADRR